MMEEERVSSPIASYDYISNSVSPNGNNTFASTVHVPSPTLPPNDSRRFDLLEQRMSGTTPTLNSSANNNNNKSPPLNSIIASHRDSNGDEHHSKVDFFFEYDDQQVKSSDGSDEIQKESSTGSNNSGSQLDHKTRKRRKNYTHEEDTKIMEGVKKFGTDWDEIIKWSHMERTAPQIKERFRRIAKKEKPEDNQMNKKRKTDEVNPPAKPPQTLSLSGQIGSSPATTISTTTSAPIPAPPNSSTPITTTTRGSQLSPSPASSGATLIPTDLAHLISQLDRDRKTLEDEKEKLKRKEQQVGEREEQLRKYETQLQQMQQAKTNQDTDKINHLRKTLIASLQAQATIEKEQTRQRLAQDCYKIGQITFERHGTSFVEVWQDGQTFRDLNIKMKTIEEQRDHLDKLKKEIQKKIKNKRAAESSEETIAGIDELLLQEELCKVKLQNLKRDSLELNMEKDKLIISKNLHIRDLKRAHDEDQSRFNNHPVLKNRYVLLKLLGKGGFSEVYKAYDVVELREVACKIHQLNTLWSDRKKENYIKHAIREYNIHKSVVHPRIVSLFDVFEIDDNSFCTVLEYCNGPDLDLYLKTQPTLSEREAKAIIIQIFTGLRYLNELKRPIIHYDLKPGNILFHNGEVKITDFGLSKIMEENQDAMELTSQGAGTYWYLPPECFESGNPKITSKVDVWSVGVILFQMLFGKKPFGNNLSQQKILADNIIINSTLEFPSKPSVSKEAKDFIRKCLFRNQDDRPDAKACLNDPFLKQTGIKKDKKKEGLDR